MFERPVHLTNRTIGGRYLSEEFEVVTLTGSVDEYGDFTESESSRTTVSGVSAPPSDSQKKLLEDGGIRVADARRFWILNGTIEVKVADHDSGGDQIVWDGKTYLVKSFSDWGNFQEVLGVLKTAIK